MPEDLDRLHEQARNKNLYIGVTVTAVERDAQGSVVKCTR